MEFSCAPATDRDLLLNNNYNAWLLLPAQQLATGAGFQNPSSWQGFWLGTQKILDSWRAEIGKAVLSPEKQTSFWTDFVTAKRTYSAEGKEITEEIFVPNELPALMVEWNEEAVVRPFFDMRERYSDLGGGKKVGYKVEGAGNGLLVSDGAVWAFVLGEPSGKEERVRVEHEDGLVAFRLVGKRGRELLSPAAFKGNRLIIGFGRSADEARKAAEQLHKSHGDLKEERRKTLDYLWNEYVLETGNEQFDQAYRAVLAQLTSVQHGSALPASGDRWFAGDLGWSRDTGISLGAFLELGFNDAARKILDFWLSEGMQREDGRVPNNMHTMGYNSSDGTPWLIRRLHQYYEGSGDLDFIKTKEPVIVKFFNGLAKHYMNEDGFVRSGPGESWMDTEFTPREGFPVEVQALNIINCWRWSSFFPELNEVTKKAVINFEIFSVDKYLADFVDQTGNVIDRLTPNQLVAIDILSGEPKKQALATVRAKLAGKGIRTLSPDDKDYRPKHVGAASYHQGCQWPWLNHLAAIGELEVENQDEAWWSYVQPLAEHALNEAGIGGISEIFNGDGSLTECPHYQTWSMASFITAAHAFLGCRWSAVKRTVTIEPRKPADWPYIKARKHFGDLTVDINYEESDSELKLELEPAGWSSWVLEGILTLPKKAKVAKVMENGAESFDYFQEEEEGRTKIKLKGLCEKREIVVALKKD